MLLLFLYHDYYRFLMLSIFIRLYFTSIFEFPLDKTTYRWH